MLEKIRRCLPAIGIKRHRTPQEVDEDGHLLLGHVVRSRQWEAVAVHVSREVGRLQLWDSQKIAWKMRATAISSRDFFGLFFFRGEIFFFFFFF